MAEKPASPAPTASRKTPMTEEELDRLEALLASPALNEGALPLDALQGMLCAVLSGPRLVAADAWMRLAIGDRPRFESDAQADEVDRLLLRLHDNVAAELLSDAGISLILYPLDEGGREFDYATWCAGYLEGVELCESVAAATDGAGPSEVADEEADRLLLPFLALSGALADDPQLRAELDFAPADEAAKMRHWKKHFVDCVLDAHDYWLERRLTPATFRHPQAKPGRNDPCYCGSGRKYKLCHGA